MDCKTIHERRIADDYLAGRLGDEEADAYERHFFECDECFDDLRFREELAGQLQRDGETLFAAEIAAERKTSAEIGADAEHEGGPRRAGAARKHPGGRSRLTLTRRRAWAGGLAAAAAILALVFLTRYSTDRSAVWSDLWSPVPHPYVASDLRGGPGAHEFQRGMDFYAQGRYREAAECLELSAGLAPSDGELHFYLGVSLLLGDQAREAARALETALRQTPSSSLYRWYFAQALLADGRAGAAEAELESLAGAGGEYAAEARALLRKISTAGRR